MIRHIICSIFVLIIEQEKMARQKFGGTHTEQKLAALKKYMNAYTTALQKQPFKLAFFDAFAGTGEIELPNSSAPLFEGADAQTFIDGSARLALQCEPKFDSYVLVEKAASKARALENLRLEHAEIADRIEIVRGEANDQLRSFCKSRNWRKWRAVVFLDPFGNQVKWETIEAVAETESIDLWYLFPSGLGVHRQIGRDGTVHYTHGDSMDRLLGTSEWRNSFLQTETAPDLFSVGRNVTRKTATPESITRFMIERMRTIFKGGVLDDWLPLGSNNATMYSLLFAWANPSEKAKLAATLASAVLRSERRGRAKRH